MGWAKKDHQVCLAHLIREAQYAIDAGDDAFAPSLRKLLKRACAIAGRRPHLADATLRSYAYKLDGALDALMRIVPPMRPAKSSNRRSKAAGVTCSSSLSVAPSSPPTTAPSKRCVIFRKVTNCFRSQWGANLYADIRSVLETARRRAIGALNAIRLTLNGMPLAVPAPHSSG
jgi:transposase